MASYAGYTGGGYDTYVAEEPKRMCDSCGKEVVSTLKMVSISSKYKTLYFHRDCFHEMAGEEYIKKLKLNEIYDDGKGFNVKDVDMDEVADILNNMKHSGPIR